MRVYVCVSERWVYRVKDNSSSTKSLDCKMTQQKNVEPNKVVKFKTSIYDVDVHTTQYSVQRTWKWMSRVYCSIVCDLISQWLLHNVTSISNDASFAPVSDIFIIWMFRTAEIRLHWIKNNYRMKNSTEIYGGWRILRAKVQWILSPNRNHCACVSFSHVQKV